MLTHLNKASGFDIKSDIPFGGFPLIMLHNESCWSAFLSFEPVKSAISTKSTSITPRSLCHAFDSAYTLASGIQSWESCIIKPFRSFCIQISTLSHDLRRPLSALQEKSTKPSGAGNADGDTQLNRGPSFTDDACTAISCESIDDSLISQSFGKLIPVEEPIRK